MKNKILVSFFMSCCYISTTLAEPDCFPKPKLEQLLQFSLEQLMDVEITTAGRVAEKISEIPASVIFITRQDIENYGYSSIEELLEHISGVYKIDTYDSRGVTYGVRGFWNAQLNRNFIILINGVPQVADYDASYSVEHLVSIEAIDCVEVVRGPMSVIYGSGAFFGVINLITNEGDKTTPSYRLSVGLGSEQTRKAFAEVYHSYKDGQLAINASTYNTDGLDYPYSEMASQVIRPAIGESTGGRLENQRKQVNLSASYKDFSLEILQVNAEKEFGYALPTIGPGNSRSTEVTRIQLKYKDYLTDQLSLEAKLGYSNLDTELYYDTASVKAGTYGSQTIYSRAYDAELSAVWQLNDKLDFVSGIQYHHISKLSSNRYIPVVSNASRQVELAPNDASVNWGAFTQMSYQPNERWKWIGGIRLQQDLTYDGIIPASNTAKEIHTIDSTAIRVIPRLALIYKPHPSHIFKFLYSNAENSPSFSQTFLYTESKPTLNSEQIQTLEVDYLTYLSPRYLLSLNLFSNKLDGLLIRQVDIKDNTFNTFISNSGYWQTRGIELSLQAQPTEALELELSLTYQTTKDRDNSELTVAYSPQWLGQVKAAYHVNSKTKLALTGYYVSQMESYFDLTKKNAQGGFGARIGETSDAYFVLNTNLRLQDWWIKGIFANLHLYNVLDTEIRYPTTTENTWADKGLLGPGRTVLFNIGYQF